nr:hypothetical protein [Promineifilum sp.]
MNQLQPIDTRRRPKDQLQAELEQAQRELVAAEADLAQEQAAVNAFRMHARLMLDDLADAVMALLAEKQSLLTRLELERQDAEAEQNPLGPNAEPQPVADEVEDLLMPTPTARDKAAEKRLYRE